MREIKFRAKRLDNGEWVYGYYCQVEGKHFIILDDALIEEDEFGLSCGIEGFVEVIPETVGQFICKEDEQEIWEGDRIKFTEKPPLQGDKPVSDIGVVEYNNKEMCYDINKTLDVGHIGGHILLCLFANCKFEVIGNIHENPELLAQPQMAGS